jgi:hypothetical protein
VSNTRFFISRDTRIFNLIKLYWLRKAFVSHVVEEKGTQNQSILHNVEPMENKIDVMSRVVYNIEIIVNDNMDP